MKKPLILISSFCLLLLNGCSSDEPSQEEINETAQEFLEAHNKYRTEVGIDGLVWSDELATSAAEWAEELESNCTFQHSDGNYGENLWKGTSNAFSITDVVDSWGGEKQHYNYESNSCVDGEVCGHYTQIVWSATTEVGCGTATCDGYDIWVCQYSSQGNIVGQKPY
ncbi:MAG: pathogenesis-related family 1 protein [Cyclobacteriaceae bacterium]